jgi:hypothetical protein
MFVAFVPQSLNDRLDIFWQIASQPNCLHLLRHHVYASQNRFGGVHRTPVD